nr:hypothetical protein Iba_chr02eCG6440 [Ipomoea batatas]
MATSVSSPVTNCFINENSTEVLLEVKFEGLFDLFLKNFGITLKVTELRFKERLDLGFRSRGKERHGLGSRS